MKKFQRFLAILFVLLLFFSFASCEKTPEKSDDKTEETTKEEMFQNMTDEQIFTSYSSSFSYEDFSYAVCFLPIDNTIDANNLSMKMEAVAKTKTTYQVVCICLKNTENNQAKFCVVSSNENANLETYKTALTSCNCENNPTVENIREALFLGYLRLQEKTIAEETIYSNTLEKETHFYVILPSEGNCENLPVLWLYHGMYQNESDYFSYTGVYNLAQQYHVAVVIPNCSDSFCLDNSLGNYYTYLTTELVDYIRENYPVSSNRYDNIVAGISMGGYGAWLLTLRRPDLFSGAGSLSGCLDIAYTLKVCGWTESAKKAFGEDFREGTKGTDRDLMKLLDDFDDITNPNTRFFSCCGTSDGDPLVCHNNIVKYMKNNADWLDFTAKTSTGTHDWTYWNSTLPDLFDWAFGE